MHRNDQIGVAELMAMKPEGIVLSPPISIARHVIGAWLAEHAATDASK